MSEYSESNINSLWLINIYENLKNLENYERLAYEGCSSLMDYLQIPPSMRTKELSDTRFKNLRFICTEINLLLTDLTPIVEEDTLKHVRGIVDTIHKALIHKDMFINEEYSEVRKMLVSSEPTELFYDTLKTLTNMRIILIKEIKPLLFIKEEKKDKGKPW